jgi:DNA-binding transcriptional MocR family regulator
LVFSRSIAEAKVAFVPGQAFFTGRPGRNILRLNFTLTDPVTIDEGVKRLGCLLNQMLAA